MSKTVAKQSIILLESKQSEYTYNVNRERRGEEGRERDRQTDRQRLGKRERRKCADRNMAKKQVKESLTHKEPDRDRHIDRQYAPFIRKYISINEDTGLVQY